MCLEAMEWVCLTVHAGILLHQLLPSRAKGDAAWLLPGLHNLLLSCQDPWHEAKVQLQASS